jgi:hypothetical protein
MADSGKIPFQLLFAFLIASAPVRGCPPTDGSAEDGTGGRAGTIAALGRDRAGGR